MTGFLALAILTITLIAALEHSHRRHSDPWSRPTTSEPGNDRDWARTKLDLLAASAQAEPFSHKPIRAGQSDRGHTPGALHRGRTKHFDARAA